MALITDILNTIKNARKGKDMRQAIYNGIQQCYEDATGHPDSVAAVVERLKIEKGRIDELATSQTFTGNYTQSNLVFHAYRNATTGDPDPDDSYNYEGTSGKHEMPICKIFQKGTLDFAEKQSNEKVKILKEGLYIFELRIFISGSGELDIEARINDVSQRYNAWKIVAQSTEETKIIAYILYLKGDDVVSFYGTPGLQASVRAPVSDVNCYVLDWIGKAQISDCSKEISDIRVGTDGNTYPTAGEAIREQIGNLTEDLDTQKNFLVFPVNMLNPESFTIGYVINNTDGSLLAHDRYSVSDFVEVHKGAVYTGKHAYHYYGQNLKIIYYNSDKKFVETKAPESVDSTNSIVKFTAIMNGYVRVVVETSSISDSMFVNSDAYPSKYLAYSKKILKQDVVVDGQNVENISKKVSAELTRLEIGTFKNRIIENEIKILDNYLRADGTISTGAYCAEITDIKTNEIYHIKCKSGSAVRPYVVKNSAGAIVRYFASEEAWNTQHDYDVTITISAKENGGTLIINSIAKDYIGVKREENRFLINGERIEEKSISLSKLEKTDNVLFQRTAIFDGDSICHGTSVGSSDPTYGQGWAGRIGKLNNMNYKNYGISGGVITSNDAFEDIDLHSVVDNIDNMYNDYPDADYIIFEGGTNDADRLGVFTDNSKVGTLDITDFSGNYDVKTFTGALETIFFKATKYWSGKHIGYIVAQKMGYGSKQYDKEHSNRRAYFERAIEVCEKWGIPYKDLWNDCYLNPKNPNMYTYGKTADENIALGNLYVDGQHLSAGGYDYISPIIEGWMKTI